MRHLFQNHKSLVRGRERSGLLSCTGKFLALTTELCIAKILKRELDGRAAKLQENEFPGWCRLPRRINTE